MASMKVLHVIDHLHRYNGMVHAAVDLACQQAVDGHVVSLWSSGGEMGEIARDSGVKVFTAAYRFQPFNAGILLLHVARTIALLRPDVIHAHMVRSALLAWLPSRLFGSTLITCVQNSSRGAVLMIIGDGIITGCEAVKRKMQRRGLPGHKLRPVLNGTIGAARSRHSPPSTKVLERPAILTICGLHPRKGVDKLITAFSACNVRLPKLHLYIIGDGPDRAIYENIVADRSVCNVHFCGYVSDTRPYMKGADAFVLASLTDPAPLVISEAREAGLAVVATDVDGIPEMLENAKAGLLVKADAPEELANALVYLFSDQSILEMWRQRSQINIARMRVSRVAEETCNVYREFLLQSRVRCLRKPRL